jgi:protein involved in polysaccharide export with SLBB domain
MKSPQLFYARAVLARIVVPLFIIVLLVWSLPVRAQGQINVETLAQLLQAFQGAEGAGATESTTVIGRKLFGGPGDILDAARESAFRALTETRRGLAGGRDPTEVVAKLSDDELLVVEAFCTGVGTRSDELLLSLIKAFSELERDYCSRARETLLQIGYNLFDGLFAPEALLNGVVQDDYILGIGDELIVTFRGQVSRRSALSVDREGRVLVQDLPPIMAAGRSLGSFRRDLESATNTAFISTQVFVSVGSLRVASVLVAGEVAEPGLFQVTGFSSIVDAIGLAGGVSKTGSLRNIRVHRGNEIFWVDFYDLLFGRGTSTNLAIFDGDRIVVPTIGATVAIGGEVKRPGIFELGDGQSNTSVREIVELAGGLIRPRGARFEHLRIVDDGSEQIYDHANQDALAENSDLIIVSRQQNIRVGGVSIEGHVRLAGRRALSSVPTVGELLRGPETFLPDPYLLFGIMETTDPSTQARRLFPINFHNVLEGREDFALREGDKLIVLGASDIRYLLSPEVQRAIILNSNNRLAVGSGQLRSGNGEQVSAGVPIENTAALGALQDIVGGFQSDDQSESSAQEDGENIVSGSGLGFSNCRAIRWLSQLVNSSREGRFAAANTGTTFDRGRGVTLAPCRAVFERNPLLLSFVLEHATGIAGEVRQPGIYPLVGPTPLASVIAVVGGLTREVDLTKVELTSFSIDSLAGAGGANRALLNLASTGIQNISVGPGDLIRFGAVFSDRDVGPVTLAGEFLRPGTYPIRRGERLSEIIARAGGLTQQAYPYGAIFTREGVRRAEKLALKRLARELNAAATVAAANRGIDGSAIAAFSALSKEIENAPAIGRVVMEADPTVLQIRPEFDIVLQPGDRLIMPKRPNSVLVAGDVLNPGAQQFVSGTRVDQYIRRAGGIQQSADEGRIFIVLPNGEAQPTSVNAFNFTKTTIPPGSTIVVPKDATPFDLFTFTRELATVLSQLAITAASLAVIGNN